MPEDEDAGDEGKDVFEGEDVCEGDHDVVCCGGW